MKNIFEEALTLQTFLRSKGYRFCINGGIALQRWGEPRTTNDIDLTLLTGFINEEKFIDALLDQYEGRLPDTKEVALDARVLLLRSASGVGIDIALGGMPFETSSVERASEAEFLPGVSLLTCSAEDLVVHKAFIRRSRGAPKTGSTSKVFSSGRRALIGSISPLT